MSNPGNQETENNETFLTEIENLWSYTTPGPWEVTGNGVEVWVSSARAVPVAQCSWANARNSDAMAISRAPTDIAKLIQRIRAAERLIGVMAGSSPPYYLREWQDWRGAQ